MRVIQFDGEQKAKERFRIIYQGFLLGVPEGGIRGLEANRRVMSILDKLEVISEPLTAQVPVSEGSEEMKEEYLYFQTGDLVRELRDEGGELSLTEPELEMVKRHLDAAPWTVQAARAVVETVAVLEEAAAS